MKTPERLVRFTAGQPTIDRDKRTIRNTVVTRLLARDGGIVLPEGIVTKFFEQNPVVKAAHGQGPDRHSPVIGRSLGLERTRIGFDSTTQFADTELGREYAYLYGLNDAGEVYMRAWSVGWATLELKEWTLDEAKRYLGTDWDEASLDSYTRRTDRVWVSVRSELHEYSAVAVGADREALSRAYGANVRAAGELLAAIDLKEAAAQLNALREEMTGQKDRIAKLEGQIQALTRDGEAAARRGDSANVLTAVRDLAGQIRR